MSRADTINYGTGVCKPLVDIEAVACAFIAALRVAIVKEVASSLQA